MLFFFVLTLLCHCIYAQDKIKERLKQTVFFLASDTLYGRKAGSQHEKKCALMLAGEFRSAGLKKPAGDSFLQEFHFVIDSGETLISQNIIGQINNRADKTIIWGAHYDHIGMGGKYSRSIGKTALHPGADDNASGVALLLELARHIKKKGGRKFNHIFIAFGAHEPGLFGSTQYVEAHLPDPASICVMINLDMVGRMDSASRLLVCEKDAPSFADSLLIQTGNPGLNLNIRELTMGDHTPFREKGVPVMRFTTGIHDDYHTIYDKPQKINYQGMLQVLGFLERLLTRLGDSGPTPESDGP